MIRNFVIGVAFLGVTIGLLMMQPSARSDRFVADDLATVPVTQPVAAIAPADDVPSEKPTLLIAEPVPAPVTQPILELKNIQAVNIATDAATKTAPIEGLEPLIATALSQGMSGAEIDILIAQAVQSGMINVPPHMLRGNGDVYTRAVLGTLVNLPAPKIVRPLGNTYVVRPGDTLAVIAQRYYGTSDAIDDIYWANKDRLANPDALSVGQTLFLAKF